MRAVLILALFFSIPAFSGEYDAIDAHALSASIDDERSIASLSNYLAGPAKDDEEKARAIYRWMTDRIDYDVDAFFRNDNAGPGAALYSRKGLCSGYARLFEALARGAGLEVVTVKGHAKGYGFSTGGPELAHEWNAVRIRGSWRLVDSTWGSGYVRDGRFVRAFSERYFLASPEELAFSHFPDSSSWQLQMHKLTFQEFEHLPLPGPAFFNLGITGEQAWRAVSDSDFGGEFVHTFDTPYHLVYVKDAPLAYRLHPGRTLHWMFESAAFEKMAVMYGRRWIELAGKSGRFEKRLTAGERGDITVFGKLGGESNYRAVLAYRVQ
jgi:hypothetical protein